MRGHELAHWWGPASLGPVELRVPAEARHLTMLRGLVQNFSRQQGFAADATTDVVLAVEEAAELLIACSTSGAILTCRCTVVPGRLRAAVSATTVGGELPGRYTDGWLMLTTITDALSAWRSEYEPRRGVDRTVHIEFAKSFAAGHTG